MIKIKIAAYALNDFLWACYCSNIKDITVTKEDNELIIYLKLEASKCGVAPIKALEGMKNDNN